MPTEEQLRISREGTAPDITGKLMSAEFKDKAGKAWSGIKGSVGAVAGGTAVGAAAGTAYGMNTKTRKSNTELAMWGAGAGALATGLYSGRNLIKKGASKLTDKVFDKVGKNASAKAGMSDAESNALNGLAEGAETVAKSTGAKGSTKGRTVMDAGTGEVTTKEPGMLAGIGSKIKGMFGGGSGGGGGKASSPWAAPGGSSSRGWSPTPSAPAPIALSGPSGMAGLPAPSSMGHAPISGAAPAPIPLSDQGFFAGLRNT